MKLIIECSFDQNDWHELPDRKGAENAARANLFIRSKINLEGGFIPVELPSWIMALIRGDK